MIHPILDHPRTVMLVSISLLALALVAVPFLGGEFLPEFNEGNLIIHMIGAAGTSLEESLRTGTIRATAIDWGAGGDKNGPTGGSSGAWRRHLWDKLQ